MSTFNRRTFLGTSAVAGAAMAAPSALGANGRLRVGVIGLRVRGAQLARQMLDIDAFDLAALCDCDTAMIDGTVAALEGKLPRRPKLHQDFRRVLEDPEIDAVAIAAPDYWHAPMTLLALHAGKHVYVEKPLSYNIDDGKRMLRAAERHADRVVMVGTQHRSAPHIRQVEDMVKGGALGKVAFCRTWITHDREPIPVVPDSAPPASMDYDLWVGPAPFHPHNVNRCHYNWHWIRDWGTGETGNFGAHWLDTARQILGLGLPNSVTAVGGTHVTRDIKQWPDTQTVLYEYPELTLVWELRLWTTFGPHGLDHGIEIGGEKGSIVLDRAMWVHCPKGGEPKEHKAEKFDALHPANFADSILGKAKTNASVEVGFKSAMLCHLGNISMLVGRTLKVDVENQAIDGDKEASTILNRDYRAPWDKEIRAAMG